MPMKWVAARYSKKRVGIGRSGGPAEFYYLVPEDFDWDQEDTKRVRAIVAALNRIDSNRIASQIRRKRSRKDTR